MGQCMSRKAVAAFTTSAVAIHQQNYHNMSKHLMSPEEEIKPSMKKATSKGIATSFGFRKKSVTSPNAPPSCTLTANNPSAARRLANASESVDSNGNSGGAATEPPVAADDTAGLTANAVATGRSTPHRLPAPKKEAQANTKPSRFGFRQPNANRLNRVADVNVNPPARIEYNGNLDAHTKERETIESEIKAKVEMQQRALLDSNKNVSGPGAKYTLHSNQLPRPQPVKLLESKTAKTLANNSRKQHAHGRGHGHQERVGGASGDESYFTEDSGVGSNCGDREQPIEQLEKSPMSRRARGRCVKPRALEVLAGRNTFDVRDARAPADEDAVAPPAAHCQRANAGVVRDRAAEYQRNVIDKLQQQHEQTKNPTYGQGQKALAMRKSSEEDRRATQVYKKMEKIARFIKKPQDRSTDRNNSSSDDQMWSSHAGEAMAEECSSACNSSSDESRDKPPPPPSPPLPVASLITAKASDRLSLVDPQFAAIAALHRAAPLILDEPSPVDSINCSSSSDTNDAKDNDQKALMEGARASRSHSKDVNEKNSSGPGSPTNASRSLSSSDGREDFLIDDEIADQPALLFDDTITNSNQPSEATPTIVGSTPKPPRKAMGACEGSPMSLTHRRFGRARAGSLDTLSPCESIASDDCMMDYDLSSGIEDANDRTETNSHFTLDDMPLPVRTVDLKITNVMRDWSSLLSGCDMPRDSSKRMTFRASRLLRSRGGTPTPTTPDSPRKTTTPLPAASPLRLSGRSSTGAAGYDSDDSAVIRIDRTVIQDVMGLKAGLLKLKRVLHEPANEDYLTRSDTRNSLSENGFFNGYGSDSDRDPEDGGNLREEMANLRRQVVYLQGQLDDSERATKTLRQEVISLSLKCESSQSAPASVCAAMCNAATQTERIRPISAGPALLSDGDDATPGSLVSASEQSGARTPPTCTSTPTASRSRPSTSTKAAPAQRSPGRLWRMPGEPPSPSAIPRRSCSRPRVAHASSSAATPT